MRYEGKKATKQKKEPRLEDMRMRGVSPACPHFYDSSEITQPPRDPQFKSHYSGNLKINMFIKDHWINSAETRGKAL